MVHGRGEEEIPLTKANYQSYFAPHHGEVHPLTSKTTTKGKTTSRKPKTGSARLGSSRSAPAPPPAVRKSGNTKRVKNNDGKFNAWKGDTAEEDEALFYSITQPFSPAGHEARWMTPFTMYPTVADEGYTTFSPLISQGSAAGTGITALFLRGGPKNTITYNYEIVDGATTWATTGATTLDLGRNSSAFYDRPCGIGIRIKMIESSELYTSRVIMMPMPPVLDTPATYVASLPVDPNQPLTASQKAWGARETILSSGGSTMLFCAPADTRCTDLLTTTTARGVSGFANMALLIGCPSTSVQPLTMCEVEVIYRYEGIELLSPNATSHTDSKIKRTSPNAFTKVINGVVSTVEKGWNFVKEEGGKIKKLYETGKTVLHWLGLSALPPELQLAALTAGVKGYAADQAVRRTFAAIEEKKDLPDRSSDEKKAPYVGRKRNQQASPNSIPSLSLDDEPLVITPTSARKPSLALTR